MTLSFNDEQQARLQADVQAELERREWAEPEDNVMAEYITVLLANGNTQERVLHQIDDLVGADFDARFLDWLFSRAQEIVSSPPESSSDPLPSPTATASTTAGRGRLVNSALGSLSQPEKRKADNGPGEPSKKRVLETAPSGPRNMGPEGKGLLGRMGNKAPNGGRGLPIRGMGGRNMGGPGQGMGSGPMNGGGFQPGFRPNMMQQGFGGFFQPGQQEMMAQMMMMQANMAHMGEMMQKMAEEKEAVQQTVPVRPPRPPPPAKIPAGTKLGGHSVSSLPPKRSSSPGPIPEKPSSTALCKYSVGCSNSRCPYSHPSPAADEKTGMVLSEEPCEAGKDCLDAECVKSHVSPAASLGVAAGPSRMLCKFQNCTNPSCAFRHEDADGNPIPPPALTASKVKKEIKVVKVEVPAPSSDNEDGDMEVVVSSKSLMDGPLEDATGERPCRYGERCTRPDCKFSHPAGRSTFKGGYRKPFGSSNGSYGGSMNMSKKFNSAAADTKLDPSVGEFKPAEVKEVST